MKTKKNKHTGLLLLLVVVLSFFDGMGQGKPTDTLSLTEFLGYVKKYHPRMRQANLEISKAEAGLMIARGAFDPKIEVDFNEKQFKGAEYYSLLNSSFKIPTWYGIEVKAGFDNSEGMYVNPENTLPNTGLTSLGITVPLGQGLLINQRMADLRMARLQIGLGKAAQQLQAVNTLYDASLAYFNWIKAYNEMELYRQYLDFANQRYTGIKRSIELGDKRAIDSIEAGIVIKNRKLNLEDAKLKLIKAKLELSNFLWIENTPVELQNTLVPEAALDKKIAAVLGVDVLAPALPEDHPKILSLQAELDMLKIERKLTANMLLPKVDIGYHYLSEPAAFDNYRFEDYKVGLNFSFPIFLRKERGYLQLTKLKILDTEFELDFQKAALQNKISAGQNEIEALQRQMELTNQLVADYASMLASEERLFSFGESSLFLINARENSLVTSRISQIDLQNRYLNANASLMQLLAGIPEI